MLNFRILNRLYYVMMTLFAVAIVAATFIPLDRSRDISHAQSTDTPHIMAFTTNLESVTPDEAESGEMLTTLSWETLGVTDDHTLKLDVLVLGEWQASLESNTELAPSDSLEVTVPHTLDFLAPSWRLSIVTVDGQTVLDSQELTLEYAVEEDVKPEIVTFETDLETIDINDLSLGHARIPVSWEIVNRVPNSNLQFVQVYNAGNVIGTINIELPRDVEWIRSKDEGMLAPVVPPNTQFYSRILLRLQIVDREDPTIIYTFKDIAVDVEGELMATATPRSPRSTIVDASTQTIDAGPTTSSNCENDFFFEEAGREYVINGGGALNWGVFDLCPTSSPEIGQAVYQMYDNGFMLWRSSAGVNEVYFLTNDGLGVVAESLYTGDDVVITETPHDASTILPEGVLGEAWQRRRDLSRSLGWPMDTAQHYDITFQETLGGEYEGLVMTLPTGGRFFIRYGVVGERPLLWGWINATN